MRNFTLGRIWDIPIRVNVSLLVFLPVLAWLIGSGEQIPIYAELITGLTGAIFDLDTLQGGNTPWLIGIVSAVGLFMSVTIHELGHSWVALRYGLSIESITLWILGGIAALSEIPREWNREFWIAIAGPISSVFVAVVCYLAVLLIPANFPIIRFIFGWLAITNIILVVFNLLPAFPMDGGRILRAIMARSMPYAAATRLAGRIGVVFAILFAVVGALSFNVILLLLALFIYGAATTESRTVLLDELMNGLTVGDVMTRNPASISDQTSVEDLINRMVGDRQTNYPIQANDGQLIGVVSLTDIKKVDERDRSTTSVSEIMNTIPLISESSDAFDGFLTISQAPGGTAFVEHEGEITGLISQSDYAHLLELKRGLGVTVAS